MSYAGRLTRRSDPAVVSAVLDRWQAGESASQAARALGVTKNQVIGWVNRARAMGDARAVLRGQPATIVAAATATGPKPPRNRPPADPARFAGALRSVVRPASGATQRAGRAAGDASPSHTPAARDIPRPANMGLRVILGLAAMKAAPAPRRVEASGVAPIGFAGQCGCQWPMWGMGKAPMPPVFCEAPRVPGRPYCPSHCRVAYRFVTSFAAPEDGAATPLRVHGAPQASDSRTRSGVFPPGQTAALGASPGAALLPGEG